MKPQRILFVCLGNICRSPLAEGLFHQHATNAGVDHLFTLDSAGTNGLHIGERPDDRTRRNAAVHGLKLNHLGRKFSEKDFEKFDLIVVMDKHNYRTVLEYSNKEVDVQKIHFIRQWDTEGKDEEVPDPWYGGEEGFEEVYQILRRSTLGLLKQMMADGVQPSVN